MSFIRPPECSMCKIHDIKGRKLLNKLRVEFSDIRSRRSKHHFNCPSPLCSCHLGEEDNSHCFIRCPPYQRIRIILLSNIPRIIGSDISILPREHLSNIYLYGSNVYKKTTNKLILIETLLILIETLEYIRKSERFNGLEGFSWQFLASTMLSCSRLPCHILLYLFYFCFFISFFSFFLFNFSQLISARWLKSQSY